MQPLSENNVNVPAFLSKLWKMVNDPTTDHLISWSQSGSSFIIQNQAQFWYDLLPVHYKHNNMSSFVRQLNMYGFHKISAMDNGSTDNDKDEIQFFHPNFQKNKPELLKNIKRKVTGSSKNNALATENSNQGVVSSDDFFKVLTDVRLLKGKQKTVDTQLLAMKQENAILWRELALLRQKHIKQQQIVNKLIQFLVTIVQPSSRMGGLGVKRHYPLMLDESPNKIKKPAPSECTSTDGPIIHELDSAEILQGELLAEAQSPAEDVTSQHMETASEHASEINSDIFFDSPEFMEKSMLSDILSDNDLQEQISKGDTNDIDSQQKVFLNPVTQDTLLSNVMNGSYNSKRIQDAKELKKDNEESTLANAAEETTVATRDFSRTFSRLNSIDDMDSHVESTQGELNQLQDLLNGYSTLDANALLGLFNGDCPPYGLPCNQSEEASKNDPMVSGSELATYGPSIDFSQLFDDSSEEPARSADPTPSTNVDAGGSITTPQLLNEAPLFPAATS